MAASRQAILEGWRAQLRALDVRIARMREQHANSTDPLAQRLLDYAMRERAELRAKLLRGDCLR